MQFNIVILPVLYPADRTTPFHFLIPPTCYRNNEQMPGIPYPQHCLYIHIEPILCADIRGIKIQHKITTTSVPVERILN